MKISRKYSLLFALFLVGVAFVGFAAWALQPTDCSRKTPDSDIRSLKARLEHYKSLNGDYPATKQGLQTLGVVPKDPLSYDYVYRYPGKRYPNGYDLFAGGPDRTAYTADDDWGK
jgi:hypothetical protein